MMTVLWSEASVGEEAVAVRSERGARRRRVGVGAMTVEVGGWRDGGGGDRDSGTGAAKADKAMVCWMGLRKGLRMGTETVRASSGLRDGDGGARYLQRRAGNAESICMHVTRQRVQGRFRVVQQCRKNLDPAPEPFRYRTLLPLVVVQAAPSQRMKKDFNLFLPRATHFPPSHHLRNKKAFPQPSHRKQLTTTLTMAFVNLLPVSAPPASAATAARSTCRRRPRMAALDAPVKEDLRTKLNDLLKATPSTIDCPDTDNQKSKQKVDPGKKYKVLIYNDEVHSKDYVTKVLLKVVPGLTQEAAHHIMQMAHTNGRAIVGVWVFEISEGYCDMLRSNGLRSDIEEA